MGGNNVADASNDNNEGWQRWTAMIEEEGKGNSGSNDRQQQ